MILLCLLKGHCEIADSMDATNDETRQCYICKGRGERSVKQREIGKKKKISTIISCGQCQGKGVIVKSKRRNTDGSFRQKSGRTYPSFETVDPAPYVVTHDINVSLEGDEDLSYLTGNWRLFQKIDKHRYSTDDLVVSWISVQKAKSIGLANPTYLGICNSMLMLVLYTVSIH